jgi:pimeloyl-ACP methyl ester carboxylesterase
MQTAVSTVKTTDGFTLHVQTWGESNNTPIIMVHGYPDSHTVWDQIAQDLAQDYYVITYDVRGAGKSDTPKSIRAYRLEQLAQDLAAVAKQTVGERGFHLVGHDWGSIQSWESVTTPRLQGQILSFSTLSGPSLDHAAIWLRDRAKDSKRTFFGQLAKSWYIAFFHLPWAAPLVWQLVWGKYWHKAVELMEQRKDLPQNPSQTADGVRGVNLYRANFMGRLWHPQQRFAHCPVQAIVLERDAFVGKALMDDLARWVPDLTVHRLNAGHWGILSRPQEVAALVRQFILTQS